MVFKSEAKNNEPTSKISDFVEFEERSDDEKQKLIGNLENKTKNKQNKAGVCLKRERAKIIENWELLQ